MKTPAYILLFFLMLTWGCKSPGKLNTKSYGVNCNHDDYYCTLCVSTPQKMKTEWRVVHNQSGQVVEEGRVYEDGTRKKWILYTPDGGMVVYKYKKHRTVVKHWPGYDPREYENTSE